MAQMNLRNRNRDIENKLTLLGEKVGWINWEIGIDIHTLLYIKQIINKDLLLTETSSQYSVMTYMGKESKKVDICITDSLCCTTETNTTVYINYTPILKIVM